MIDVEYTLTRFKAIKNSRSTWESHWEEIAERVLPRQTGFTGSSGSQTKGEKKTQKVFDSKPMIALDRFAAVMDSMLTPRQTKWHNLKSTNPELNKNFEVQDWFYQVNNILFGARYAPKANYAGQNHERWTSLGAFGTGAMYTDFESGTGLRYRTVNLKNIYILENHQGVIDTVFREFEYTPRQAIQKWGKERLPEKLLKAAESPRQQEDKFTFIHVVAPREDFNPERADAKGKPWGSYYISLDSKDLVTPEGGYNSFPYSISRYVTAPDEIYGRSPAMMALPDIKMLNEMGKTDIRAVHKLIDPPILLHDDGIRGGGMKINMKPGGLTMGGVSRDGRQLIQPFGTGARADISETKMDQRRQSIDDAFLVTLFQILVDTPRS